MASVADQSLLPINELYSDEAEQSVLGSLLFCVETNDGKLFECLQLLSAEDFYQHLHRIIYTLFCRELENSRSLDMVAFQAVLNSESEIKNPEKILSYVEVLRENIASSDYLLPHAQVVRDFSIRRSLLSASNQIATLARHPDGKEVDNLLSDAENKILAIAQGPNATGNVHHIGDVLKETLDILEDYYKNKSSFTGLETGFPWLDNKTAGLQNGDLIVLAARPGMGKTSMAMNIVEHVLVKKQDDNQVDRPIIFFSMEMPGVQIGRRLLASLGGVDIRSIATGNITESQWGAIQKGAGRIKDTLLYLDSSSVLDIPKIRHSINRVMHVQKQHPALIVIDYLQLMSSVTKSNYALENRNQEISVITRNLKSIAKEQECPLLLLSQLSRPQNRKQDLKPNLADLRDSGAIEQDADIVLFLHPHDATETVSENNQEIELIIGKHRNGSLGTCLLNFAGPTTHFTEKPQEVQQDYEEKLRQGGYDDVPPVDD